MSRLPDTPHEVIATAARPFVEPIGADLIGTASRAIGSIVSGSEDSLTEDQPADKGG